METAKPPKISIKQIAVASDTKNGTTLYALPFCVPRSA